MNKSNRTNHNNPIDPEFVMEIPEGYELVPENKMDGGWHKGSKFWMKCFGWTYNSLNYGGCFHTKGYKVIRPIVNKNTSAIKTTSYKSIQEFMKEEGVSKEVQDRVNELQEIDSLNLELQEANEKIAKLKNDLHAAEFREKATQDIVNHLEGKVAELEKAQPTPARLLPITDPMPPVAEGYARVYVHHVNEKGKPQIWYARFSECHFCLEFKIPEEFNPINEERKKFEEYTKARKFYSESDFLFVGGQYQTPSLQQNWNTWQAAVANNKKS